MSEEYIKDVKKELILWYMNADKIKLTEKEIYEYSQLYNIPFQIFLKKLLERLISTEIERESAIEILLTNLNLQLNEEAQNYVLELYDTLKPSKIVHRSNIIKKGTWEIFKKIDIFVSEQKLHKSQPLPDPEKGRPFLDWKKCCHENCGEVFSTADALISHLKKFNVYTPKYHKFHEDIVKDMNLTVELILSKGIKKCPSYLCNFKSNNESDLILHFAKLGIKPFWKEGMSFNSNTGYNFDSDKKIFDCEECVICYESIPNIIFDKCMHVCYCIECYEKHIKNTNVLRCPVCRESFDKIYPY